MVTVIGTVRTSRQIDQVSGLMAGAIRYARVWTDRKEGAMVRDAFFEAIEAPELIEEPVFVAAQPVSVRSRNSGGMLKAAPRRTRQVRLHRPSLATAIAA